MRPPAKTFQELHEAVRAALVAAGESECPLRRTRTTGRVRYWPDVVGFRILRRCDPLFESSKHCTNARSYLCVGCASHKLKVLNRYYDILQAAGFDVRTHGVHHYKTMRYVWIKQVFDHYDKALPAQAI